MQLVAKMSLACKLIVIALLVQAFEAKSISEFLNVDKVTKAKLVVSAATCLATSGVKTSQITDLQNLKFADDPHVNGYLKCYMEKVGWIKEEGGEIKFDMDTVNHFLYEKHVDMAKTCSANAGTDPEVAPYSFYKCLMVEFHK